MKGVEKKGVEKKGAEKKEERVEYVVNVLRAKDFTEISKLDTNVNFDMDVNGIKIYDCWFKEGTSKNGKDFSLVSLPSKIGKDGNYYSVAWFPISKELTKEIREQIVNML